MDNLGRSITSTEGKHVAPLTAGEEYAQTLIRQAGGADRAWEMMTAPSAPSAPSTGSTATSRLGTMLSGGVVIPPRPSTSTLLASAAEHMHHFETCLSSFPPRFTEAREELNAARTDLTRAEDRDPETGALRGILYGSIEDGRNATSLRGEIQNAQRRLIVAERTTAESSLRPSS